jgi:hypothetical protein
MIIDALFAPATAAILAAAFAAASTAFSGRRGRLRRRGSRSSRGGLAFGKSAEIGKRLTVV